MLFQKNCLCPMKCLIKSKVVASVTVVLTTLFSGSVCAGDISSCTFDGIPLYGKVKVVNYFPDIKVKVVSSFEDLDVQTVNAFADDCGKWQFVDSFEDFKVQFVDSFPDITVKFVQSFPGQR